MNSFGHIWIYDMINRFLDKRWGVFCDDIIHNNAGSTINHFGWFNCTNNMVYLLFRSGKYKSCSIMNHFNLSCKRKPQLYPVYSFEEESKNYEIMNNHRGPFFPLEENSVNHWRKLRERSPDPCNQECPLLND